MAQKLTYGQKKKSNLVSTLAEHGAKHTITEEAAKLLLNVHIDLATGGLFSIAQLAGKKAIENALGYRNSINSWNENGDLIELKGRFQVTSKGARPISITGAKLVKTREQVERDLAESQHREQLLKYEKLMVEEQMAQAQARLQMMADEDRARRAEQRQKKEISKKVIDQYAKRHKLRRLV